MAGRVAGICFVKVGGEQLEVSGDLECPLTDTIKEAVMSQNGVSGLKETRVKAYVKLSAIFSASFPLDTLQSSNDLSVVAEFPNGKVYTLSGAFLAGEPTAKADEGKIELQFEGTRGKWS